MAHCSMSIRNGRQMRRRQGTIPIGRQNTVLVGARRSMLAVTVTESRLYKILTPAAVKAITIRRDTLPIASQKHTMTKSQHELVHGSRFVSWRELQYDVVIEKPLALHRHFFPPFYICLFVRSTVELRLCSTCLCVMM